MRRYVLVTLLLGTAALIATGSQAQSLVPVIHQSSPILHTIAAGRTCKSVSSCEEAVELWCSGYSRADADHDGIPCENICHSVEQVDEIRKRIGCGE